MTRLIDADALRKTLEDGLNVYDEESIGINRAIEILESAPTVETTDDVLERIDVKDCIIQRCDTPSWNTGAFVAGNWMNREYGMTPYKAVKKLEASINAK